MPPDGVTDIKLAAFAIKHAAVELRAGAPAVRLAVGGIGRAIAADQLAALYAEDVASYLDAVVIAASGSANADVVAAIVEKADPGASVAQSGVALRAGDTIVSTELDRLVGAIDATSYAGDADRVRAAVAGASGIADLLSSELVRLEASTDAARLRAGRPAGTISSTTRSDSRPCWRTCAISLLARTPST